MSNITIQGGNGDGGNETDTSCLEILLIVAIVFLWIIASGIKEIRQLVSESKSTAIEQTESEVEK